jgi:hypothetical protein
MAEIGIVVDTPCREWRGTVLNIGYGQLRRGKKRHVTHRYVWELANGPIPPGMFICHRCDNRKCYRLDHLFLGTAADNTADMWAKGRGPAGAQRRKMTTGEHERIKFDFTPSLADRRRELSMTLMVLVFGHAKQFDELGELEHQMSAYRTKQAA